MAFLVSLALHAAVLMLAIAPLVAISPDGRRGAPRYLQVSLLPAAPLSSRLPADPAQDFRGGQVSPEGSKRHGMRAVPVFVEAQLVSDINLHVEDVAAFGFMVLSVEIDADGVVVATTILHSDFSPDVAASVEHEFATARFKPAELDGKKQGAQLLFRVDVD